jgi:PAS domain S-box-containing protein
MSQVEPQLFKSFNDAMPYGACLVNLEGKIVYWNVAAEGISGYLGAEVLGRAYRGDLLVHYESDKGCAEVQCPLADVLRDGRTVTADLFLRHKDGHRLPVRLSAFSLRDAAGEVIGVGEIFNRTQPEPENTGWPGYSGREFEMATGLPAVEESQQQLEAMLHSRTASSSALILIEMSEQRAILKHGGEAMLHRAIRTLARTVASMLPTPHYVGCWSAWRLLAIVPDCHPDALAKLQVALASVSSSCAVKWWGDRIPVGTRAAARHVDPSKSADALIRDLELDLKSASDKLDSKRVADRKE